MSRAREFADLASSADAGGITGKNLVTNGAMQVAQRGTSVTGITSSPGYVTVDRFQLSTVIGTLTAEQSTDAPDGFSNSFKVSCTTAESTASLNSNDYIQLTQRIEAQNLQQLAMGTSNAKPMALSFWVKSNITGTGTVEIQQKDNSDRQVTPSYTINSANTWEYKTISIPADTSGLINNDNGIGLSVLFWLQSGSDFTGGTNQTSWTTESNTDRNASNLEFATSTSDYFAITGVQLEVGEQATPFEHRSYGDELARCQRYYYNSYENVADVEGAASAGACYAVAMITATDRYVANLNFPVEMRAAPVVTYYGGRDAVADTSDRVAVYNGDTLRAFSTSLVVSKKGLSGYFDTGSADGAVRFQFIAEAEL